MRILALDLGARRIGLAVSDDSGRIALPVGHLERRGLRVDLEALRQLAGERQVGEVVVGLPVHMSGREGDEARAAREFARALGEATGLPVELLDERWTTREAERVLRGGRARGQRGRVDAVAASLLLSTYLERRRGAAGGGAS